MKLDVLVVAAHPDDAEISVGGILLNLRDAGRAFGIVDLTRGEMGTRGSADDRAREVAAANAILRPAARENLGLPDGRVEVTLEARERLAGLIRRFQPEVLLAHHADDLHPDHAACGRLAREAWYLSGLQRLAGPGETARRPRRLYHFLGHVPTEPTFVVDVGRVFEEKRRLVQCYASQLRPDGAADTGQHFLFGADVLQRMETRARFFGERIGARHGEPLVHVGPLPCMDPLLA
ncbi:MAG: bacillithiol biosynthesis deacetylase BshB1 [Planctomycetes bacterium]|nr:bacillithiol biosynthesis deacetylase BshB1 [Planctomycetota bacterium]